MPSNIITGLQNDLTYTFRQVTYNTEGRPNSKLQGALASCLTRAGIEIGTLPVGTKIVLTLGGVNWTWLVVQQGLPSSMYDASCNGTWLLLEKIYENRQWHSSNVNDYANSTIHAYLNSTFLNLFSAKIRAKIKQVKIPYRPGSGTSHTVNSGTNGLPCRVFLLSGYEVGWTNSDNPGFVSDGGKLAYFLPSASTDANNKRIARFNSNTYDWWIRSPGFGVSSDACCVRSGGSFGVVSCAIASGIRPCIILPSDFLLSPTQNADGSWSPLKP